MAMYAFVSEAADNAREDGYEVGCDVLEAQGPELHDRLRSVAMDMSTYLSDTINVYRLVPMKDLQYVTCDGKDDWDAAMER